MSQVPTLDGANYSLWKMRLKIKLMGKGFPEDIFLSTGADSIQNLKDGAAKGMLFYRHAIGKLNYASIATRPDITFAVNFLGRFMANPTEFHLKLCINLIRYLYGSMSLSISFPRHSASFFLVGYGDADWAGDLNDRKSTSGSLFLLCSAQQASPISWESKKQSTTAQSSTEAEYISMNQTTREAVWLRSLLSCLGYPQDSPTTIYVDNLPAIELSKNSTHHRRTKHIDIQFHFIREKIESGEVKFVHCPSHVQMADILTKASKKDQFVSVREAILHPF